MKTREEVKEHIEGIVDKMRSLMNDAFQNGPDGVAGFMSKDENGDSCRTYDMNEIMGMFDEQAANEDSEKIGLPYIDPVKNGTYSFKTPDGEVDEGIPNVDFELKMLMVKKLDEGYEILN